METKNVILKRPKRKLCYTTVKESRPKQWVDEMTLGDVDRMFDDMDSSSHCDSQVSSSPQQKSSDSDTQHSGGDASLLPRDFVKSTQKVPEGNALLPAKRLISLKPGTDFQMPGPVKTSSPIEENVVVEHVEEEIIGRTLASPILFDCEDEEKEEATTESLTAQKSPFIGESVLNSPPRKFAFRKPTVSCHKNKVDGPLTEETQEKPQTSKGKGKTSTQENTGKPTPTVRKASEHVSLEKLSTGLCGQLQVDTSTRAGKDIPAFLQKLRDAGQPKPARKLPTPVKTPPLPAELEDNFLILEDDVPLLFTIPKKPATSRRQKRGSSSSTDKDVSTEMGTSNSPRESVQKENEPVIQKTKRKKERTKKNEGTGPGNEKDEFTSPEDVPADDLWEQEQEKQSKKKKLKKIPSKECDKAEEEATDAIREETADENPAQRAEKKVQKTSEAKRLKSSKENAKTSIAESLKGSRKVKQGSRGIKASENYEVVKGPSQTRHSTKHVDVDLDSLADDHIMNLDTEAKDSAGGKVKQKKQQIMSEGSFSEEGQILCKRKRKPVGQWWLSCPQSTEETEVKDDQPTLKKSKQRNKEPSAPRPSPAKAKKDNTKKRTLKQPTLSSSQETIKAKQKSPKKIKNRPVREGTQNEKTSTDEVLNTSEAQQTEEQQQVPNKDPDPVQSSPSVFTQTDSCLNSGYQGQPFSPETWSHGLAPVTPKRASTADSEKRRRKSPGNWWVANGTSEDVESTSLKPQQLQNKKKPKSHKERQKRAKPSRSPGLGIPQNGNLPKPTDRSHMSPLKPKPLSAPKTVKRSLATFKDIFTSRSDTPPSGAGGSGPAGPAGTHTDKDLVSMDDGDLRSTQHSPNSHDAPQSSGHQSENTLRDLRSGPSSMVMLEQSDGMFVLPPSVPPELRLSDLCAPPLKPLHLQPKDKANLTEWFKSLWSSSVDNGDITADHFDWYFYQGQAMGVLADLNCDSICNGKILLGSYMKKPLWVDHSATTVFNLLTSSVSVIVDGRKSSVNAGDSFMVQCGQAYSIQNTSAQPAVLYFTRILAESSD